MTVASQDINQDIKNLSKLELSLLNQSLIDDFYMKRALELAVSGPMGCVSPNPYVGAVIVKNHQIIGEGYHAKSGEAHAEIHALNSAIKAGHDPAGATIYVSLEPCNHQGKTGPCTHALIAANIREVVYAIQDPNPLVSGCGHKYLEEAGILVRFGVCEAQARFINRIFIQQQIQTSQKNINLKRPYIILKAAMSLDGKLATQSYDSKWITGETARQKGHEFRTLCDAILIGKGTLLADNPSLTVRDVSKEQPIDLSVEHVQHVKHVKQPIRVVVLSDFSEISSDFLIFDTRVAPTWLIYPESSFIHPDLSASLIRQNVRLVPVLTIPVLTIPVLTAPVLTVPVILDCLSKQGVQSILVEGGPKIHSAFLDADCVDEYILFYGACFIGGRKAPSLWDESGVQSMSQARKITLISSEILDQNIFVHAMSLVNSNSNSNLQKQGGDSCSPGLIEEVGKLKSIRKSSSMARVQIMASHILVDAQLGDSIACNGVCLTICKINRDSFDAELMPETLNKTQFSNYLPNAPINLERAIRADARLGGHIVSGHIDTFGRVNAINQHSNSHILQIQFDECYAGLVIPKGSIAIDGVSLTVIECTHNSMTVGIIPHTFTHTIFASLKVGGAVNLEFDGQAKYAKAALQLTEKHKNSLSLDQLSKWGY